MPFTIFRENLVLSKCKNNNKDGKIKRWCLEWNKVIGSCFAFLTFFILLIFVIYNTTSELDAEECMDCKNICTGLPEARNGNEKCSILGNEVICKDINEMDTNLAEEINRVLQGAPNQIVLAINNFTFSKTTLEHGWLSSLASHVTELHVENSNIEEIGERAFEGYPFDCLVTLTIVNSMIQTLKRKSFVESSLTRFELRFNNPRTSTAEADALKGMRWLTILQITRCLVYEETIQNLTGKMASSLNQLENIDFSYNALSSLGEGSFSGARNVRSLYLRNNQLEKLHARTFCSSQSYQAYQKIFLNDNSLKTLPAGIFDCINNDARLSLYRNLWICTCELQWLKIAYMVDSYVDKTEKLLCQNYEWKPFEDVDFCANRTTTSTTSELTSRTSEGPGTQNLVRIFCRDLTKYPVIIPQDVQIYHKKTVFIGDPKMELVILEYDINPPIIQFVLKGNIKNITLFWFNSRRKEDRGCVQNFVNEAVLNELLRNNTYTICFTQNPNRTILPYDCIGLMVTVGKELKGFLLQKHKPYFIGFGICGILLTMATAGYLTFCCIKRHPTLIKISNRVIVAGSKGEDMVFAPKTYQNPPYVDPSIVSQAEGYLTPKYHKYAKLQNRPVMLRSVSERSVFSNTVNYIETDGERHVYKELQRKYTRKRSNLSSLVQDYEDIYEKPPLPPNHPCERKLCGNF